MSSDTKQRQAVVPTYKKFTAAFGADAGLNWFSSGVSFDSATRLNSTAFGRRLMQFDAADELSAFDFAGVCHWSVEQLSQWGVPDPDRTTGRNGGGLRFWRVSTIAQWAAAGCPGPSGRPRPELLAKIGADAPEAPREKTNLQRIADGIAKPGR